MKHQYFGDINDYRKYGLLRALGCGDLTTLVAWMLTPNDTGSDGKFVQYLSEPLRWRKFDPQLFDILQDSVIRRGVRSTAEIETPAALPRSTFVRTILDGSPDSRSRFLAELRLAATNVDLVFFDPDNGLEVRSLSKRSKAAPKYVFWNEVEMTWRQGPSLLVYQHFPRIERHRYLRTVADEFRDRLRADTVAACVTSNVAFFLVPQGHRTRTLLERATQVQQQWPGQISLSLL